MLVLWLHQQPIAASRVVETLQRNVVLETVFPYTRRALELAHLRPPRSQEEQRPPLQHLLNQLGQAHRKQACLQVGYTLVVCSEFGLFHLSFVHYELTSWLGTTYLQMKTPTISCQHSHTKFGTPRQMMPHLVLHGANSLDSMRLESNMARNVVSAQDSGETQLGPNSSQSAEILKTSMLPLHHQLIPIRLNHNSSLAARSQPRIPTPNATPSALATRTTTAALATDLRITRGPPPRSNGLSPLETLPESTLY